MATWTEGDEGLDHGRRAVRLARESVARAVAGDRSGGAPSGAAEPLPPFFARPRGVFVTIRRFPGDELRGCIGFPRPVFPLGRAVREAAIAAATEDPRFPGLTARELGRVTFEVSILTEPEPVVAEPGRSLAERVTVGRDGLIVEGFGTSGLLLPQVAPEQGWTAEEFLDGTCEKAGLPAGAWRDPRVRVLRFAAAVYAERSPDGPVEATDPGATSRAGRPGPRT